jgi:uncharacterized protein YjgD (DUF1641 family)
MAQPILLKPPSSDPREALYRRLENAPHEHAEALLTLCDIVQGLHDKGLLELAKGALGSGEKVLQILVDTADSPEVFRGIRNVLILTKLFATLEPTLLEHLAEAVPKALAQAGTEKPFGLVQLLSKFSSQNSRRILTIAARVIESLGKDLEHDP